MSLIYILLGEEDFLKERALLKIKKKCFPKENEASQSFNCASFDGKAATSAKIIAECQQLPFMNSCRLVIVKDADKTIDDSLIEYIKNPVKTTCLVLLPRKIDKRLNTYKVLEKHSEIQEFEHPNEGDFTDWIQSYIKNKGKRISAQDASYIAVILNTNLTGTQQELEKLITYAGRNETITNSDIKAIISENRIQDSFALTESIQNKDTSGAIKLINKLLDQGDAVQQIMGAMRWMLTRLWLGKELLQHGNRNDLSRELRIPSFFIGKFIAQAEKFDISEIKKGLVKLLELEKLMRTYKLPENLVLELLVIQLTHSQQAARKQKAIETR